MSQSPAAKEEFERARNADSNFRKSLEQINNLMRQGGSLSGHERNCLFLNTQGSSFATASSVTGFDFADDARGLVTVDWDADGDLDVWISNRTSPRIRFMRNDLPSPSRRFSLFLKGQSCNRDAIGARVTVYPTTNSRPLTKSLRAGEGYLSQSSKWLLFGLDQERRSEPHRHVSKVEIQWPGGELQTIHNLEAGKRYVVVEGAEPEVVLDRPTPSGIQPSEQPKFQATSRARIALTSPIPCPALPYRSFDGQPTTNAIENEGPTLVNLWASWCQPCLKELQQITNHRDDIREAKLHVVAIAVDSELGESSSVSPEEIVERLQFPFPAGNSTPELVQRLRVIHDLPFSMEVDMPVPVSFLLDGQDRVVAIYRGPISVSELLKDTATLQRGLEAWQRTALPLPGRWNEPPVAINRLTIPRDLLTRRQTGEALRYVKQFAAQLSSEKELPTLYAWLGDELIKTNRVREGLEQYELALAKSPNELTLINNFAWQLATQSDASVRNGKLAVRWAERAAKATSYRNAGILDTLAASYAENGQFNKAVETVTLAIRLTNAEQQAFADRLQRRRELYQQQQPYRQ